MNALIPWQRLLGQVAIPHLAGQLGLTVGGRGPWSLAPCPCCGAAVRGDKGRGKADRRGPIYVPSHGRVWTCLRCEAKGDAAKLLAARVVGRTDGLTPDDWQACRVQAEALGYITPEGPSRKPAALRELPVEALAAERDVVPGRWEVPDAVAEHLGGSADIVGRVLARTYLAEIAGMEWGEALAGAIAYEHAVDSERRLAELWEAAMSRREMFGT